LIFGGTRAFEKPKGRPCAGLFAWRGEIRKIHGIFPILLTR
jgi:hypothetical protein